MLTAVVCSGRNRPHWSNAQWEAMASDAAFVGGGDEPEQQLGAGVVQRGEADFVEDDQVVAEQGVDDLADGVVGQPAVEGFDEIGCGAVLHPVPGGDGGVPEGDQGVRFAGPGGPIKARFALCADPFQARSGSRTWPAGSTTRRRRSSSMVLVTGNVGGLEPVGGVGGVPGGDLGLDQGAEHLFRGPALGLGGEQHLGGDAAGSAASLSRRSPAARSAGSSGTVTRGDRGSAAGAWSWVHSCCGVGSAGRACR